MTKRQTKTIVLIGVNGTGKSTTARKFIKSELANGGRAIVINPDDDDWLDLPRIDIYKPNRLRDFNGVVKHVWNGIEDLTQLQKFKNGLIVFDDCRSYLDANTNTEIRRFFVRRRHRQIDILAVTHGFTETPPAFFTFANNIILFKTNDNINRRKDVLKDFDRVAEIKTNVDKQAMNNQHYFEIINY